MAFLAFFTRKQKERKLKEVLNLPPSIILNWSFKGYSLKGSYRPVDFFKKNSEVIEDILSCKINHIERRTRWWGSDVIILYIKDYRKRFYKEETPKKKLTALLGYRFKGEMLNHCFVNKSSIAILGGAGSGKSNQINVFATSFMRNNLGYMLLIVDPKEVDYELLHSQFRDRSVYVSISTKEDFEKFDRYLEGIIKEIETFKDKLKHEKRSSNSWEHLEDRPKHIALIDETSEVIPLRQPLKNAPQEEKEEFKIKQSISKKLNLLLKKYRYTNSFYLILANQDAKVESLSLGWENIKSKVLYNMPNPQMSQTLIGSSILTDRSLFAGRAYYVSPDHNKPVKFQAPLYRSQATKDRRIPSVDKTQEKVSLVDYRVFIKQRTNEKMENFHKNLASKKSKKRFSIYVKSHASIRQKGLEYWEQYCCLLKEFRNEAIDEALILKRKKEESNKKSSIIGRIIKYFTT